MPSTVTKDIKAEENKNNQLAIRTTAVETGDPGFWAGVAISAAVSYVFSKAADYVVEKFVEWKNAGFPVSVDKQLVVVKPQHGENLLTLMTNLVKKTSDRVGSDVGVLLIQKDAIIATELNNGYDFLPIGIQMPGTPEILFNFLYAKQGSLHAEPYVNGNTAFFQIAGAISVTIVDGSKPNSYNTFTFGKN